MNLYWLLLIFFSVAVGFMYLGYRINREDLHNERFLDDNGNPLQKNDKPPADVKMEVFFPVSFPLLRHFWQAFSRRLF